MAINDAFGRHIPEINTIPAPNRLLTAEDLGEVDVEQYWAELKALEGKVEEKLHERFGLAYRHDPFKMHISELAQADRDELTFLLRQITGAEHLLAQGIGPQMFRDVLTPEGRAERSPAGRFAFTPEAIRQHPKALTLSQMTQRFDRARSTVTAEQYFPAGTQYRPQVLQHIQNLISDGMATAGNTMIFDVETPGLNRNEGIWQLSARMLKENGELEDRTFYFQNPKMRLGVIGPEAKSLDEFLTPEGKSTDYVANMKEFLKFSQQADYLGGHNIFFDYDMLQRSLKTTEAYKKDQEFTNLVDTFLSKFYDSRNNRIGNIVDTNVLARIMLPGIELAPELAGGPTPHQFSLQNILLQTNLVQRMQESGAPVNEWLAQGLHFADVDVPIEAHLWKALQEQAQGGRALEFGDFLTPEQRQSILKSRAIGPNIAISHEGQLIGDLRTRADYQGLINNITPLQQQIYMERNLGLHAAEVPIAEANLAKRINTFDRLLGEKSEFGLLTRKGLVSAAGKVPTREEWANVQTELASAGVPMPGLSWIERHVMSMMAEAPSPFSTETENTLRKTLGSDVLGLSKFIEAPELRVVGRNSQIATIPMRYLREWEQSRIDDGLRPATNFLQGQQLLGLSAFKIPDKMDPSATARSEVGLMLNLEHEDRMDLLDYLSTHPDFRENYPDLERLRQSLEENSGTYGIQVGTLGGLGGGKELDNLYDTIKYYQGIGADISDQTPMFQTLYAGEDLLQGERGSVYGAGIFVRPDLMRDEERAALPDQMVRMVRDYQNVNEADFSPGTKTLFRALKSSYTSGADALRIFKFQRGLFKAAPFAALAGVGAAAGYYGEKRHRAKQLYAQAFALMPYEGRNWYAQNQQDMIPMDPYQTPNYLATANTVSQLDYNKIRHSDIGANKYQYLFSTGT